MLTDAEILKHYTHRWKIEVMFKQHKHHLGLKFIMIRTSIAIDRFLIILTVAWFFLTCKDGVHRPLCAGAHRKGRFEYFMNLLIWSFHVKLTP